MGCAGLGRYGKPDEALRYAEASCGLNDNPARIARTCEEILLLQGRSVEAYERYALASNRGPSNIATYRSIVRKYPERDPSQILRDLLAATPGEEGKWFATAKEAGELELAARFANQSPCDPRTLTRAVRDFVDKNPEFALQAGLAAIRWLAQGYGFEITGADVWAAYSYTLKAAEQLGRRDEVARVVRSLGRQFVGGLPFPGSAAS